MFGGVFRFVVELQLGVQACAIAGWALFSCESIGPSPRHEFTDRKPDTPQPFLSSAPDEIQTAERSAWTHMVQKNSHAVRFMFTFFHLSETSRASSAQQHVLFLFSLSYKLLSAFFLQAEIQL